MSITLQEIVEIVGLQLGKRNVHPKALLVEELGAESVDLANIIALLEEKFNIELNETDFAGIRTPFDLYELLVKIS